MKFAQKLIYAYSFKLNTHYRYGNHYPSINVSYWKNKNYHVMFYEKCNTLEIEKEKLKK